ncbi:hypothetical protein M409DRAFT_24063 [Zasmidium cellare ATCC 36951]|uniref:Uncharacterized protein n=1 Tax=Zasmidium cellare ATCC 36951 TaxID=1080233 RepID=A0A6A6CEX9_ZASCE|nr:uncharacterized protein M409DRAFT_24063 [Zasmidium cellare ATCC 36951]KAF2165777.1 hypothetical protein M409DRAFT_24063 [Zasmidium cellare ATCC 36951]
MPSPPPSASILPRTTYTLTTTKSRPGDGLQGMTVECEAVSMVPKVPIWPADAPVPECHKKDSIVSASSKGKGKGKERRMSSSQAADGEGDDENSGESSESSFHNDELLDINCQPLVKSTSRISRFSAYGISAPESPRRTSSSTTAVGDDEPGEWWLEKKRRLSNTSFVSPAGRRASLSYGTVDSAKLERGLCKRCFQPRIPEATFERQNRRDACLTATWICLANAVFPFCGAGMVWWSIGHPEQPGPGFVSFELLLCCCDLGG